MLYYNVYNAIRCCFVCENWCGHPHRQKYKNRYRKREKEDQMHSAGLNIHKTLKNRYNQFLRSQFVRTPYNRTYLFSDSFFLLFENYNSFSLFFYSIKKMELEKD